MRIFVLCSGRCGSMTFIRAAKHIRNFTAGHESRWRMKSVDLKLRYPDNHIEADNRLAWMLGRLGETFAPDEVLYVHLYRDSGSCGESYAKRTEQSLTEAWNRHIMALQKVDRTAEPDRVRLATDMVDTVNANIREFLRFRPAPLLSFNFPLDGWEVAWPMFWNRIKADGDFEASLAEWQVRHNERR